MRLSDVGLALCIALGFSAASSARILNVPDDHQTIQAGIDAAEAGDTVLVQPGVYEENILLAGKGSIVVGSLTLTTGDPDFISETVIDGNNGGTVVDTVYMLRASNLILQGFTIRNGNGNIVGGVIAGGALNANFVDLLVTENRGNSYAGIAASGITDAHFTRVRIINNRGVGLYISATRATVEDCEISENSRGALVGAGQISFRNIVCLNNTRYGLSISGIVNTPFVLDHLTIAGTQMANDQGGDGLVLWTQGGTDLIVHLTNSIIWGNEGHTITLREGLQNSAAQLTVSYSDVEDSQEDIVILDGGEPEIIWDDGNIDSDPLFVDPDNGDFHLSENSPCIDAGDPDSPPDPDGTRADMGAFYFPQAHPPVLDHPIADIVVAEDCGRIEVADLDTVFSDAEGDSIWFAVFGAEALNLALNEENLLWFEPALNFNGDSLTVQVRAYAGSDSTSEEFLVTVTPVNDPPGQFNLISPDLREPDWFYRDDTIHFEWTAAVDPDNEPVNYILRIDYTGDLWSYDAGTQTSRDLPDSNDVLPWSWLGDRVSVIELATWWVVAISGSDTVRSDSTGSFGIATGVEDEPNSAPASFSINSVFPNPFNSSTTIRFSLPSSSSSSLMIYGLGGRLMDRMELGRLAAGEHSVVWNANGLPAGVYLLALESGIETKMTKIVLLK